MKKLFVLCILCVLTAFVLPAHSVNAGAYVVSGSPVSEFADIETYFPSKWASENVKLAERIGLGYPGRNEKYNRQFTRKELAYVAVNLYRAIGGVDALTLSDEDKSAISSQYSDSYRNGKLFDDEVFLAIKYNLMYGTTGSTFSPDGFVTREQTAVVLYRIVEMFIDMSDEPRADLAKFFDYAEISPYAEDCFSAMVAADVLNGLSDGTLAPRNVCTYEEVLAISVRFLQSFERGLKINLFMYYDALVESPLVVNVHTTEIEYQESKAQILDAEWLELSGALGYVVDCRRDDGTVLRTVTKNTGVTIFESNSYSEIEVFSIGAGISAGVISEYGSSLMDPPPPQEEYTGIYVYNDYAALINANVEEDFRSDYSGSNYGGSNPRNIPMRRYSSSSEALVDMREVTVRIWKMGPDNTRVPGTASIQVHYAVAQDVIDIFDEIYNGPEQFPIYAVGGYSWRGSLTSAHNMGLAIDINPDHNYFINTKGKILVGKMWEPSLSPYSIKPDGDVVRAFNKRGWFWAGIGWPSTGKDFMHLSYTGT